MYGAGEHDATRVCAYIGAVKLRGTIAFAVVAAGRRELTCSAGSGRVSPVPRVGVAGPWRAPQNTAPSYECSLIGCVTAASRDGVDANDAGARIDG